MPGAETILENLQVITNTWGPLAVLWHVYFGLLVTLLLSGCRPTRRVAATLLCIPLMSVATLAWLSSNPFNGLVFSLATVVLAGLGVVLPAVTVRTAAGPWLSAGSLLIAFGWFYPHFLEADSYLVYAYAAPTGLVPCPTLSIITGAAIVLNGLGTTAWAVVLGGLGIFYGVFGALVLGVHIDWVLAAGALCLIAQVFVNRRRHR